VTEPVVSLAEFVSTLTCADIPRDVREHAKSIILDTIGCGIFGATLPMSEQLLDALESMEGQGRFLVWGTSRRLSAGGAALANATAVHGYELDDFGLGQHNGSVALTAALATVGLDGMEPSGDDLLASFIGACEFAGRLQECLGADFQVRHGFHGPSVVGTVTAAVATARFLRLPAEQMVHAVGLAAQQAAGLMAAAKGGSGKRLLAGQAARSGVLAAVLARSGVTSNPGALGPGYGSLTFALSGGEGIGMDPLSLDLGENWLTLFSQIKKYACRVPIHSSLEAIERIRQDAQGDVEDIVSVDVSLDLGAYRAVGADWAGDDPTKAQMNLAFCVATMLLDGEVFIDQFRPERIRDAGLLALVSKVHCAAKSEPQPAGEFFGQYADVSIRFRDGRSLAVRGAAPGLPENPMARDAVNTKFDRLSALSAIGEDQAGRIRELCASVEELDNLEVLLNSLSL
jgi:2-methylcitrate dehydratase PrpD